MSQAQTDTDIKDTGVTVDPEDVINDILPFCAQGQTGRDLLSQADYAQDMQRNIGHQPGIARAQLANKQARQSAHMAAGLAQFLARRYAPGVVDDGDLDKVEAALVAAVCALRSKNDASFALCESAADEPVKAINIDDFELVPGSKVFLRFTTVNAAVNPKISINGSEAKPLLYAGVPVEVSQLAKGQVYEMIYTGEDWQIMAGMAPDRVGQTVWFEDTLSRPGYVPLNGAAIANFAATWPQMAVYLATTHGQGRCFETLAEREAAHVATWHTLASGATVGWEGFGGVCKFFYDAETDTLYMPDLRGMFRAMAGDGIVAPSMGGVMGDRAREIQGGVAHVVNVPGNLQGAYNCFYLANPSNPAQRLANGQNGGAGEALFTLGFVSSRVVPTGAANVPRSWGSLACAYFGQPSAV